MQNICASDLCNPFLLFEFANKDGDITPYCFEKPLKIITTNKIEEVLNCFHEIQNEVDGGNYAAGYLSYEAAPAFDPTFCVNKSEKMPLIWFGIFEKPIDLCMNPNLRDYQITKWKPTIHGENYHSGITKIKCAIENGDTYQVNYTTRLRSHFTGDDFAFYQQLATAQSSHYSAYLNIGDYRILSASPELFFRWNGDEIMTRPMKGTIKRGKTLDEDLKNKEWLFHSEKNRAENLMIVDLLRNDLGNIAIPGTVEVEKLFEIERYPTVWQMTSTITAKTEESVKLVDVFSALFPCGSITGAPKISTMNLISQLENTPREVYCGAIGFISPKHEAIFNVPIRTVVINDNTGEAEYGVGGGITWDSTSEDEYEEILTKASLLTTRTVPFDLLESIKLKEGTYLLLDSHIRRLKATAEYFGFEFTEKDIKNKLLDFSFQHMKGEYKVRLLLSKSGHITVSGEQIKPFNQSLFVKLAKSSIDSNNLFLYHKTTNRKTYDDQKKNIGSEVFDVLLWNEAGEVTEFTNGNVVLKINGRYFTPPVKCGLLNGTFREELLKKGVIEKKVISTEEIKFCEEIWFINSVRGWQKVNLEIEHGCQAPFIM